MGHRLQGLSILMSLYQGTKAVDFSACLESISAQSRLPDELVAVFDGPVEDAVRRCLDQFEAQHSIEVKRLEYSSNRGLGPALADGLIACSHRIVARVDTDDLCFPDRFAQQLSYFESDENLDVLGGWMVESVESDMADDPQQREQIRRVPLGASEIAKAAIYRNPLNHPTVMFRRSRVLEAGNYQPMLWFEDYFLWARMLLLGCQIRNTDVVLVQAKADADYYARRGGAVYLRSEFRLATALRRIGFHNLWQSARFMATRTLFRMVPVATRARLYSLLLRR